MLIDRYIGRAQLHAFVVVFVSLAGLYLVFDAFTNMEEFISHSATTGSLAKVLAGYYGCRLVLFFDTASPVVALASAMFALSWLERHNELTALLAAGVTRWRIARPVLVFSAVVALVAAGSRELVLPRIRESFARNAQDLRGDVLTSFAPRYDNSTEILFRGDGAQAAGSRIYAPSLVMPPQLAGHGPQITAGEAFWRAAEGERPSGYLLRGVTEPADIDALPPLEIDGRRVVMSRSTEPWLQPRECFVVSDVTFEQLIGSTNWSQYSSTPELVRAIRNPSLGVGTDIPLRVHARFMAPLLDMSLVMLGIPLVLGPSRRGVFVAVGLCVLMTVVFFLAVLGCHSLVTGDAFSPAVGAWMPLLILAPLAAWQAQAMWQ
jgi:lipopolysaccharide export system permease protein